MAVLEKELPIGGTATTKGILFTLIITFLVNHIDVSLTPAWMTFAEAIATTEGGTSSNITKIIEKLTQLEGSEVPKICTEENHVSIAAVARESC